MKASAKSLMAVIIVLVVIALPVAFNSKPAKNSGLEPTQHTTRAMEIRPVGTEREGRYGYYPGNGHFFRGAGASVVA